MNALRICAELTQLVADLTRIAAVAFLILYLLWQSVTHPLPIRDHIDTSGTLTPGATVSVVRDSDGNTMLSATCDRRGGYTLRGDLWPGAYHFEVAMPKGTE